jgi:two-component system KDP operon response regulator KdpE
VREQTTIAPVSGGSHAPPVVFSVIEISQRVQTIRGLQSEQRSNRQVCPSQELALSTQPLVLVADDEPRITKLVSLALTAEGFRVVTASGGEEALVKAEEVRPDIVLLDIVMPGIDGIEVMRQLRERRPVPVILLTARGSTTDKAKGLDLGADDYVAKPFDLDELAARVRAVLRRATGVAPGGGLVCFDDVEIDLEKRMVSRGGDLVQLSRTEWLLLQHLATNAGKVVLHTELLTKVWGPEYRDDLQYLRVWVSRVRRKLGAKAGEPGRIKTFQGIGYLLDVDGSRSEGPGGDGVASSDDTAVSGRKRDKRPGEGDPGRLLQ